MFTFANAQPSCPNICFYFGSLYVTLLTSDDRTYKPPNNYRA